MSDSQLPLDDMDPADSSSDSLDESLSDRDLGAQPIADLMLQLQLKPHDLVTASPNQITHKMVARAMKGRRLTINSKGLIQKAFNAATGKSWTQAQLFNY